MRLCRQSVARLASREGADEAVASDDPSFPAVEGKLMTRWGSNVFGLSVARLGFL